MTTPQEKRAQEKAVYWFARLIKSFGERDFILACKAADQLEKFGWVAKYSPRRARKGGAR